MSTEPNSVIDATGLFCPVPVSLLGKELDDRSTGDVVELLGDDPSILKDVQDWVPANNAEILEWSKTELVYRFLIKKGAGS